jgi:hypothetical protein
VTSPTAHKKQGPIIGGIKKDKKKCQFGIQYKNQTAIMAVSAAACAMLGILDTPILPSGKKILSKKELCKCINTYGHLIYVFDNEKS